MGPGRLQVESCEQSRIGRLFPCCPQDHTLLEFDIFDVQSPASAKVACGPIPAVIGPGDGNRNAGNGNGQIIETERKVPNFGSTINFV